jgi:hypothetical protein
LRQYPSVTKTRIFCRFMAGHACGVGWNVQLSIAVQASITNG